MLRQRWREKGSLTVIELQKALNFLVPVNDLRLVRLNFVSDPMIIILVSGRIPIPNFFVNTKHRGEVKKKTCSPF